MAYHDQSAVTGARERALEADYGARFSAEGSKTASGLNKHVFDHRISAVVLSKNDRYHLRPGGIFPMATDPNDFDDILKRFDSLTPEEREELIDRLERHHSTATNGGSGRSALDGFKERGLLGSITDAPADWSTNPKYMEGFGQDAE